MPRRRQIPRDSVHPKICRSAFLPVDDRESLAGQVEFATSGTAAINAPAILGVRLRLLPSLPLPPVEDDVDALMGSPISDHIPLQVGLIFRYNNQEW